MSLRIVVVPEDDRLDKYVLKPVFSAMLKNMGFPNAAVVVVDRPRPRGIDTVLTREFAAEVVRRFGMADVYVYCLDRDGREGRHDQLDTVLTHMRDELRDSQRATGLLAYQEVEVWCLVNDISSLADAWEVVREDGNPKERYFAPLVSSLAAPGPGQGRQILGERAARRYDLLRQRCPELAEFEGVLAELVAGL